MASISEKQLEVCAAAAHMANRAHCRAIGDMTQATWDEAPEWQKESARKGVAGVILHNNGPRESHASWLKEKESAGWKYGPVKDADKKEHPCFVPYDELPPEQQAKDDVFVSTVQAVYAALTSR